MPMPKLHAWTIFKAVTAGKEEGLNAVTALVGDEVDEYQAHVDQLNLDLAEAVVEVQNEGAALLNGSPIANRLEMIPAHHYNAQDYRELVTLFEGSKHEKLHLTAFFRIQNTELLFDLVKPATDLPPLSDHDEDVCSDGEQLCHECYEAGADCGDKA